MPDIFLQPTDLSKLSDIVRQDIIDYCLDAKCEMPTTVLDALHYYLTWNGIIGWTSSIAQIVRSGQK